jgi:hypothetical protein
MAAPVNGGQSQLEIAAIAARAALLPQNTFNNVNQANEYSATNTYALADTQTPVNGKGTGGSLDINNYGAGGSLDIYGAPQYAGSGRQSALSQNQATWGFGPTTPYQAPNTSKNIGEVVI